MNIRRVWIPRTRGLRRVVLQAAAGTGGLKATNGLIIFATSVLFARILGPEGYGIYTFALSLSTLLAFPAQLGLPVLLVREIAKHHVREQWERLRGILTWSNVVVASISIAIASVTAAALWVWPKAVGAATQQTMLWGLVLVPLIALGNVRAAALRGLRHIVVGQLPEALVRPGILLLLTLAATYWGSLVPSDVMLLHAAAGLVAVLIGTILLIKRVPVAARKARPQYMNRVWIRSLFPLSILAGMQVVRSQADVLLLGLLATERDVGIYRVAYQVSQAIAFSLVIINGILGPTIARLHESGNKRALEALVTWSTRATLFGALPVLFLVLFLGATLLRTLFGEAFAEGYQALAILSVGRAISLAAGPVLLILSMTGHEGAALGSMGRSIALNLCLSLLLIPIYGAEGAALASAITIIVWNAQLAMQVRKLLAIDSTPFTRRAGATLSERWSS